MLRKKYQDRQKDKQSSQLPQKKNKKYMRLFMYFMLHGMRIAPYKEQNNIDIFGLE